MRALLLLLLAGIASVDAATIEQHADYEYCVSRPGNRNNCVTWCVN